MFFPPKKWKMTFKLYDKPITKMESTQSLSSANRIYNRQEMQLLQEWFQQSSNILTDFLELVGKVVIVSRDLENFIHMVEHTHVPYNFEHIRASYMVVFQDTKQHFDDICESMCSFPQEFENCYNYLKQEPASHIYSDLLDMLESTLRYYIARYEVLHDTFKENRTLTIQSYELSQQSPKPCGGI
jgi:hypothetical protein